MHLLKAGWNRTICGRSVIHMDMITTSKASDVTCINCSNKIAALGAVEVYAGHEIRSVEIEYWASLRLHDRVRITRRFSETKDRHSWPWYSFSDHQRSLLLDVIRHDNNAAFILGLPGKDLGTESTAQMRERWRAQNRIIKRILKGQQDVSGLNKVLEIQEEISGVFRQE